MNRNPDLVIDASIVVRWQLTDEAEFGAAKLVRDDFIEGRIALVAPEHIRYEVPSAIRNAYRTRRVTADQGARAIQLFLGLRLPTVGDDALLHMAFEIALRFGCSYYDALYLALAESLNVPFVHADNRLRNGLGDRFPLALWVGDYSFRG